MSLSSEVPIVTKFPIGTDFQYTGAEGESHTAVVTDVIPMNHLGLESGKAILRTEESGVKKTLFVKTPMMFLPNLEREGETKAQRFCRLWSGLKQREIPTVGFVSPIDAETVVMEDLTADGSVFYGKHYDISSPEEMTDIFLNIDLEKLKVQVQDLVDLANRKGVYLPSDEPYSFLVHPDGTHDVVVLDLGLTNFFEEDDSLSDYYRESNQKNADGTTNQIIALQDRL